MAEKKYVYIDVVDTALLCGLDIKPGTLGNNEVQARCPYCGDYKYRMYLSRQPEKSTFWCHNCGTGGNAVTLYADFNPGGRRLTTKEAYLELLNHPRFIRGNPLMITTGISRSRSVLCTNAAKSIWSCFPFDFRRKHRQNLLRRGLSNEIIRGNMYRSVPTNWKQRRQAVEQLASRYDLSGMPGFYTRNFRWDLSNCRYSGILIPVCDKNSRIQGLQLRLDEPPPKTITLPDGTKARKNGERFRWLSTGGMSNGKKFYENGTGISSYIHVVGDLNCDTLHITEGA